MKYLALALAAVLPIVALAAPPPAPEVAVTTTDIRQLEFSWEAAPGAQSYQLWFRAAPGADWVLYREQSAKRARVFRVGVAVHLLDWPQARYYVSACNSSGCTASNEVGVDGEQLIAMGFVKPAGTTNHRFFGSAVAASADGKTFAVLDSEVIGAAENSATVHVYRKTTPSSGWRREARLVPSRIQPGTGQPYLGDPIALSGDGNLLALGAWTERASNGDELGAVYLFRRTGATWQQIQRIASPGRLNDWFGYSLKLDDAGRTLVVSHNQPTAENRTGTVEVYRDESGSGEFMRTATIDVPPAPAGLQPVNCEGIALSGDGQTLLRACRTSDGIEHFVQEFSAPSWSEAGRLPIPALGIALSFDGTVALLEREFFAEIWTRGPTGWTVDGRRGTAIGEQSFPRPGIALSRDGKIAALGYSSEFTLGVGPHFGPIELGDGSPGNGGVVILQRKESGWSVRRLVKPGSTHSALFGHQVALGDNGKLLIVGAPLDPSNATGLDGDRNDDSAPERGAVWVY
jgi:hypothetical protein